MKEIQLTQGKVALVDDDVFDEVNKFKWRVQNSPNVFYARRNITSQEGPRGKTETLHRQILKLKDPKIHVDHIDGNGLNNQRSNLRIATVSQNRVNSHKQPGRYISDYKGVSFYKKRGKYNYWIASVKKNGKQLYFYRHTELDAARTYDEMAIKYHGLFAKTNFPTVNS